MTESSDPADFARTGLLGGRRPASPERAREY